MRKISRRTGSPRNGVHHLKRKVEPTVETEVKPVEVAEAKAKTSSSTELILDPHIDEEPEADADGPMG
jgi:hypothetical protein